MKTIITTIALAILMISTFSGFAAEKFNPLKDMTTKAVVAVYLEATSLGNTEFNKDLFTNDFEHFNAVNNTKNGKKEYVKFLKDNKGLQYNCKTTYQILDECGKSCVAKATMEFSNFTRVDHITLSQTKDGWKVSKVVTTYP